MNPLVVAALFGGIFIWGTWLGWRAVRADRRSACMERHPAGKKKVWENPTPDQN